MTDEFLKTCKGEGIRDRQGAEQDCGRIFAAIHDIIGDGLPDDLCRELEELREKCPFCVDTFIKTLQKTADLYGVTPPKTLSDADRESLHNKLRQELAVIRDDLD
jgi:hypothetical protein